ncbi:MAG: lipoprotein [Lentisphaeria bacterium]|nr:lipoprotein [Lentisphaeria bacterium]
MKKIVIAAFAAILLAGCTSTVTHYDDKGNVVKVEEVTNFSRAMDGTNEKSQMVLIDGTFITFEASATAGENCAPGIVTKFANGKTAIINTRDDSEFTGADSVVKNFFTGKIKAGPDGVDLQ